MSASKHRNEETLRRFGEQLKKFRLEAGFTQMGLANEIDVTQKYIYELEKGKVNATICTIKTLANALGISACELIQQ